MALALKEKVAIDIEQQIIDLFSRKKIDYSWSFADKTRKDTTYISHGYHRYPAKFIPQIVSRLVEKYSKKEDLVLDPFVGSGTTLLEAKVMGRKAVGLDINPVATLISQTKITPIEPSKLEKNFLFIQSKIANQSKDNQPSPLSLFSLVDDENLSEIKKEPDKSKELEIKNERIDYWFSKENKKKLAFIFNEISKLNNKDCKNFFYCAFSNILKNCSIWMQKSNKPIRDFEKKTAEPLSVFLKQAKSMIKNNASFYELVKEKDCIQTNCLVRCADAKTIPLENETVKLIVTSPPYVTSYEYADMHQLSAFWFNYTDDLKNFRQRFIGSAYQEIQNNDLNSLIAEKIYLELLPKNKKIATGVVNYFCEMNQVFIEMKRVLQKEGNVCIVIGNTKLRGVEIFNAEVFLEQLLNLGFEVEDIIQREIPSKNLPSTRNEKTGRFASITDENKVYAYPTEYILIVKK